MLRKLSPFKNQDLKDALLAHADSLVSEQDNADSLLDRYSNFSQALEGLFSVAEMVRHALAPVDPADSFVAELKDRLTSVRFDPAAAAKELQLQKRKTALQIAGVAGLLVSGVAMLAIGIHFIIGLLGRRRRATTAA